MSGRRTPSPNGIESFMLAWSSRKLRPGEFSDTQLWLVNRWFEPSVGGLMIGVWRAFYRHHPEAVKTSPRPYVAALAAQFDAENSATVAMSAIDGVLETVKVTATP